MATPNTQLLSLPQLGPSDALWAWCKDFVVGRIQGLNLSRVGMHVYSLPAPHPELVPHWPAVQVTAEGERAERLDGTTEHKDWLLPVRVFLGDRDTAPTGQREAEWLSWHEQVLNAFDQTALGRMPFANFYWVEAQPQVAYDREAEAYRFVVGSVLLRCYTRQPRGSDRAM